MIANISRRERLFLYVFLTALAAFFIDAFAVRPLSSFYEGLESHIRRAEKRVARNREFIARKASIYEEYAKYKSYFKAVGTDEEEIASILKEIETIAGKAELKLADIKPAPIIHTRYYNRYVIEIDCEAKIGDLVKFIYELRLSDKMLRVDRLRITARKKRGPALEGYMLISRITIP